MGEKKRKHVAEVIAKATLCGAVIHEMKDHKTTKLPDEFRFLAELPDDRDFRNHLKQRIHRANGSTEYQCAVDYLRHLGVPYETLVYGGARINPSPTARLRRRKR